MKSLPAKLVIKILLENGLELSRQRGSHRIYYNPNQKRDGRQSLPRTAAHAKYQSARSRPLSNNLDSTVRCLKSNQGKKRLKRFGKVDIPAEAFTIMLKRD